LIGAATLLLINWVVVRFTYKNNKIEKLVEGEEDVLIEKGQVRQEVLDRELVTLTELEIAAHRQGFRDLSEVEQAVLEPEGGISFIAKQPEPGEARQQELLARLDSLSAEIAALRADLGKHGRVGEG
jgi:uncharacterized membrane protein YcaP (DUF421 family)